MTEDPLGVPYRERERSVTMERMGEQPLSGTEAVVEGDLHEELFTLNMGPHHPATHGVLRLLTTLEGEVVRDVKPIIGYVHTGIEKNCEDKSYWKVIPFVERMDYLSYFFNMQAFCGAVERLLELEIPPRAKYLRMIHLELNRLHSHLFWLGTTALDLGAISMLWYALRERDSIIDLFEMSTGQRMHTRYFQVGGVFGGVPLGFGENLRRFLAEMPSRISQYEAILDRNEIFLRRTKGVGIVSRERLLELGVTGPLLSTFVPILVRDALGEQRTHRRDVPRIDSLDMRIFFPQELDALISLNGLRVVEKLGDYDGSPFGTRAPKQLMICQLAGAKGGT